MTGKSLIIFFSENKTKDRHIHFQERKTTAERGYLTLKDQFMITFSFIQILSQTDGRWLTNKSSHGWVSDMICHQQPILRIKKKATIKNFCFCDWKTTC